MSAPARRAAWRGRHLLAVLLALMIPALPAHAAPPPAPEDDAAPPLEAFAALLERPLFSNTRRPALFRSDGGQNLDERQLREAWRLTGIVLHRERQTALFSRRQGDERLELEVGMPLENDWRVERIAADHVLLLHDGRSVQLLLREPAEASASPVSAPASPPPASPAPPSAPGVPAPGNG